MLAAAILTSASTQTTILPAAARTVLSMAAHKAIPEQFARIHPRFLTPTWATVAMGLVSAGFYPIFTLISENLLSALIGSLGLMIAFYYGLTGFACVWCYRKTLTGSERHFIMCGLFPLAGGVMLLAVFIYGTVQFAQPDWLTDADGNNITIFGIGAEAVVICCQVRSGFSVCSLSASRSLCWADKTLAMPLKPLLVDIGHRSGLDLVDLVGQ
ncbi:hypothetical protein [Paeniglutamicibacter sp. NPDC091659]|uniref:hypothetical protein n=1 Tax=Paeniglutamicibacter sp. NPDC091659 TaxID=3364389 RepID=UPI00381E08F4